MKLASKILLLFLVITLLFAGGGSYFVFFNLRSVLEKETGKQQLLIARQLMEEIDIFLYERLQNIKTIGQAPPIIQALASGDSDLIIKADKKLNEFFSTTGPWNNLIVINTKGDVVISSYKIQDISQRPGILAAFQSALKGQVYYSDAILSHVTEKPTIFFSFPMKDTDEAGSPIVGVVVGELAWPAITEYLEKIQEPILAHLYNKEGTVIGANQPGHQEEILKANFKDNPFFQLSLKGRESTMKAQSAHSGFNSLATNANEQGHLSYKGNNWILILETPVSIAFAGANESGWKSGLFIFALIIIFLLLLYFFVKRIFISPITEISSAMEKRAAGDMDLRVKIKTKDEIGRMSATFNQMADKLNDFYRNLEEKVRLRTKELSQKNKKSKEVQKAMVNLLEDLSAEKDNLAREKARDEAILTGIGDGVFVLDSEERIILFNPTAEKISGFAAKEAIGRKYTDILKFIFEKDGSINDEFIKETMAKGKITQMASHTFLIKKDGSKVPVADSAAPIKDEQGRIFGYVVVFRDVTKEREIDKMKTEFVSVASHQLRTPLTGIKWFTELLLKSKPNDTIKNYANQIVISNERMVRLVDDLLDVSRIEAGKKFDIILKNTDIVLIVKSVIKEQAISAKKKNIALVCSADAPHKLILSLDESKINQVFQNLVSNAIKYSKEKTKITIGCQQKKNEAIFFVKDNGVGIPQHQQSQIFNKFFRAENAFSMHTDGSGLGLYIVKAIIEAHKGKIWFESAENKGTTFFFSLPAKS